MEFPWVVLVLCSTVHLMLNSVLYSGGVTQLELLKVFEEDVATTSFLTTMPFLLSLTGAPLYGAIIEVTSCRFCCVLGGILTFVGLSASFVVTGMRPLFITYGLITGMGIGFAVQGAAVAVAFHFEENLSIAYGVFTAGAGIGSFIGPVLLTHLVETYSIRGAFLVLGAIHFNVVIFGLLLKPSSYERSSKIDTRVRYSKLCGKIFWKKLFAERHKYALLFNSPIFMAAMGSVFMAMLAISIITIHMPKHATLDGATDQQAAFLLVVMGVSNTCGKVMSGFLANSIDVDPFSVAVGLHGIVTVLTLTFQIYAHSYKMQLVYMCLLGTYTSGIFVQLMSLTIHIVDRELTSTGYAVAYMLIGLAWTVGPIVAGALVDAGQPYTTSFLLAGFFFAMGFIFTLVMGCIRTKTVTLDTTSGLKAEITDPIRRLADSTQTIQTVVEFT